jgi:hypothetical protein
MIEEKLAGRCSHRTCQTDGQCWTPFPRLIWHRRLCPSFLPTTDACPAWEPTLALGSASLDRKLDTKGPRGHVASCDNSSASSVLEVSPPCVLHRARARGVWGTSRAGGLGGEQIKKSTCKHRSRVSHRLCTLSSNFQSTGGKITDDNTNFGWFSWRHRYLRRWC